jgi:hypothetical protein
MTLFDANRWYQINLPIFDKRSMVAQQIQPPNTTTDVYFKITVNPANERRWQIYPIDDTRYMLRSQLSSPNTYLAIQRDTNDQDARRGSIATMRSVIGAHDEVFWRITKFQNGGYMLVNSANGTNWHLHAETPDIISMTNNITGEQDNQKFGFTALVPINNDTFSSVQVQVDPCHLCYSVSCSNIRSYHPERIHRWPQHQTTTPLAD